MRFYSLHTDHGVTQHSFIAIICISTDYRLTFLTHLKWVIILSFYPHMMP